MNMPERSFGRTVRYRRTKLGLSQAKLAELVGRTTPTIRSWERDKSRPNDPQVLAALAAILGVDEKHLFDKAEVERPEVETSPTVEQALATLSLAEVDLTDRTSGDGDEGGEGDDVSDRALVPAGDAKEAIVEGQPVPNVPVRAPEPDREGQLVGASASVSGPAYMAPPEPYQQTPLTPTLNDLSYMEDNSQRQLYRVRTLATFVALIALVIAFIWALGEGLGALSEWWDEFFGNLQL